MDVYLTQEELVLNRKSFTEDRGGYKKPVKTRTEIKMPLKRVQIVSTKQSYVKEQLIIKKNPMTETQSVTEEVTNEKILKNSARCFYYILSSLMLSLHNTYCKAGGKSSRQRNA